MCPLNYEQLILTTMVIEQKSLSALLVMAKQPLRMCIARTEKNEHTTFDKAEIASSAKQILLPQNPSESSSESVPPRVKKTGSPPKY